MTQLEQIEALRDEAERKRDEALANGGAFYGGHAAETRAYTAAAELARPLQEAVDALRCNIWALFAFVDPLNEKAELSAAEGADFEATFYRARADAADQIGATLHCCLEQAGLC